MKNAGTRFQTQFEQSKEFKFTMKNVETKFQTHNFNRAKN